MTVAPTSEMASGRKTKIFARDSRRMRSKRAAVSRPSPTLPDVAIRSQRMLLRRISRNGGVARLAQLASVKAPFSSWKLPITVRTAGYTR